MIKITIKDLRLFLADKKATLLTFLLPIPLITLFSLSFGGSGKSPQSHPMQLLMADEDKSLSSQKLMANIDSLKEINVKLSTSDSAEHWIRTGAADAVLIIHQGLKDSLESGKQLPLELRYDKAKEMQMGILMAALGGHFTQLIGPQAMARRAMARFDKQNPGLDSGMRTGVHAMIAGNFGEGNKSGGEEPMFKATAIEPDKQTSPGLVQAVAGTAVMMLLFSVAGLGAALLQEKEEGTLKKLLFSPIRPESILSGKILSANIIGFLQLLIMFLYSALVFGLNIWSHIPAMLLMILVTAFACSGFGILLAAVAKSRAQVQGLSTLIVLTMSALGGSMIPSFIMPLWMQKMAAFTVNYWSIQGFYDIFWRAIPVTDPIFLSRLGVLFLIGLGLNLLALRLFKKTMLSLA